MSRRHRAKKQIIHPDSRYHDVVVAKFINSVMLSGKKSIAENIVYGAFDLMEEKTKGDAIKLFYDAIAKVRPHLEVRSRRVGGTTYQVPMEVRAERAQALAFRWIIEMARKRSEITMKERLARELIDAVHERGSAIKKREDTHKMAEANRAFAHYRW